MWLRFLNPGFQHMIKHRHGDLPGFSEEKTCNYPEKEPHNQKGPIAIRVCLAAFLKEWLDRNERGSTRFYETVRALQRSPGKACDLSLRKPMETTGLEKSDPGIYLFCLVSGKQRGPENKKQNGERGNSFWGRKGHPENTRDMHRIRSQPRLEGLRAPCLVLGCRAKKWLPLYQCANRLSMRGYVGGGPGPLTVSTNRSTKKSTTKNKQLCSFLKLGTRAGLKPKLLVLHLGG